MRPRESGWFLDKLTWVENEVAFGRGEFAPLARGEGEVGEAQRADACAQEPERGVADGGGHAANLSIFPFSQLQRDPAIRYGFPHADGWVAGRKGWFGIEPPGATGKRFMVAETQPFGELDE